MGDGDEDLSLRPGPPETGTGGNLLGTTESTRKGFRSQETTPIAPMKSEGRVF